MNRLNFILCSVLMLLVGGLCAQSPAKYFAHKRKAFQSAAGGGFSFISSAAANGTGSAATTAATDTTGAKLIVVWVSRYQGPAASVTDSAGNTWVALTNATMNISVQGFYCVGPTTSATHTFTGTASGAFPSVAVHFFSGSGTITLDAQAGHVNESSPTSIQPGSRTPSQDNCLIVSGCGFGAANTLSVDGSFTSLVQINYSAGVAMGVGAAHLIQVSAAASNPTWSWGSGAMAATAQAIFKSN